VVNLIKICFYSKYLHIISQGESTIEISEISHFV